MPTIPAWQEINWKRCKVALAKLKRREPRALEEILELIVPSINNSIVGASKVLHFAYPDRVPIIDGNVVIGWRELFFPSGLRAKRESDVAALPSDFGAYGNKAKKRTAHIALYVRYAEDLATWTSALRNISAREVETKLYLLGKQVRDEAKKRKKKAYSEQ
jgi:hypothetical protein